jgi:hypothetical protein
MDSPLNGAAALARVVSVTNPPAEGTHGVGAGFEGLLGALRTRSGLPGASNSLPPAAPGDGVLGRLDDSRRRLQASMTEVERTPSPAALSRLAVFQSDYTLSAQVAIRAIQKSVQALTELSRLQ